MGFLVGHDPEKLRLMLGVLTWVFASVGAFVCTYYGILLLHYGLWTALLWVAKAMARIFAWVVRWVALLVLAVVGC